MALPEPYPARRAETEDERRDRLVAEFDALRLGVRERNPGLTEAEWDALAVEWSDAVDNGLRERVRRLGGGAEEVVRLRQVVHENRWARFGREFVQPTLVGHLRPTNDAPVSVTG